MGKPLIFVVLLLLCNGVKNHEKSQPFYAQNLYPHIKTEVIDVPDNAVGDLNPIIEGPAYYGLHSGPTSYPLFEPQLGATVKDAKNNPSQIKTELIDVPNNAVGDLNPILGGYTPYGLYSGPTSYPLFQSQLGANVKDVKNEVIGVPNNAVDDLNPMLGGYTPYGLYSGPTSYPLFQSQLGANVKDVKNNNPSHIRTEVIDVPNNAVGDLNPILGGYTPYGLYSGPTSYPLFQSQLSATVKDVKNNNPSHIRTEVIDVPNNAVGDLNPILGGYTPYGLHSGPTSYPLFQSQLGATVKDVKNNLQYENQNIPANNVQNLMQQQVSPTNYPYVNPYPYYNGINPYVPLNPTYQFPQNFYNPYQYRPFYPGSYIQYRYPYLYNQFPNGFYILPDMTNIPGISDVTIEKREDTATTASTADSVSISDNTRPNIPIPQSSVPQQFSYSNLGERKTYTNDIELKPISTILTRYNGPDGKSHVKVITSDASGNKTESSSDYTGNINLKITNGVLEEPINLNRTIKTLEDSGYAEIDPNGIFQPEQTTEAVDTDDTPQESGKPDDVHSWL